MLEKYHPYITDHILDELVTYFSYRVDRRHAASVAEAILKKIDEGELDMVHADREILTQALTWLVEPADIYDSFPSLEKCDVVEV